MSESDLRKSDVTRFPLVDGGTTDVAALVATIRRLSTAHSVEEIMAVVTQAARELLAADGITFVLREDDLCFYAEEDAIAPLWKGKRFPMSACVSGWCMIEGQAAVIPDIYQDPRIPQDAYRPTFVKSLAMVPVRQEAPMAAIGAYWARTRTPAAAEVDLLQTIANSAALALAKVELEWRQEKERKAQRELGRRLQNILSLIETMSQQTLQTSKGLEEFSQDFASRLAALTRVQSLLNENGMTGLGLVELIRAQLLIGDDGRVECDGPSMRLAPHEALDLGLVLYELGDNARRHGALRGDTGQVKIAWHEKNDGPRRFLEISWQEAGGPEVTPPAVGGFGSALFGGAFRKDGGHMRLRYDPAGLVCAMRILLA